MNIAILGAGAWGTALAVALAREHRITLCARRPEHAARLRAARANEYLPGIALPQSVALADDIEGAVRGCELVLAATPTAGLRGALAKLPPRAEGRALLWACKGFEPETTRLPHEIAA